MSPVEVVGVNLTDVGPDGESDPLSEVILELAVAATKVVRSPADLVAAQVSLAALRGSVEGHLSYYPQLLEAVERLVQLADGQFGVSDD